MQSYRVTKIKDDDYHIHVIMKCGKKENNVNLSAVYKRDLKPGMKFCVHTDEIGAEAAYSFNNQFVLNYHLRNFVALEEFVTGFKGIKNFSLDKMHLNIALLRALHAKKEKLSFSPLLNMLRWRGM